MRSVKIGVIGCGYVSDFYMESLPNHPELEVVGVADRNMDRARIIAEHYGTKAFPSVDALLADPTIKLVVNLTSPESHFEINKAALLAGKHVYSEKPLAVKTSEGEALMALAAERGLIVSGAPCSILSETAQTMWRLVVDGAVGQPRLVYAELDDSPIYLMKPEGWTSATGAPWPYRNEYESGCTLEHAGYYLTWLCAMFGPAVQMTSFSACLIESKTPLPLDPADTPDFSVACITFASGVVARLTCSIIAPMDHRFRVIGTEGVLTTDEAWNYTAPVYLERFSQLSLNARKSISVRTSSLLQAIFGIRGKRVPFDAPSSMLARMWADIRSRHRRPLRALIKAIKSREIFSIDYFRGVASMAAAIEGRGPLPLSPDFLMHVTELTLAIQAAGTERPTFVPKTTFKPLTPPQKAGAAEYSWQTKPGLVTQATDWLIALLHQH